MHPGIVKKQLGWNKLKGRQECALEEETEEQSPGILREKISWVLKVSFKLQRNKKVLVPFRLQLSMRRRNCTAPFKKLSNKDGKMGIF